MRPGFLDRSAPRSDQALQLASLAVIFLALTLAFPALLVPLGLPIEGDAVDYRVPLLRWILRHKEFPNFPWTMVDDYPALGELLMLPLFAITPALARLVPITAYLGLGVAGGVLAVTLDRGRSGYSRAALFWTGAAWTLALRPLALQANVLMTDNLASCFLLFSALFAVRGVAAAAGACAAAGLATRYNVWGTMAVLPALIFFFSEGRKLKAVMIFCAIAACGALPFMMRNYLLNGGHPFFPVDDPHVMEKWGVLDYGRGRDFGSFLLLPFDLLYTNTYVKGIFDYTLGKLFYVQLVFAGIAAAFSMFRKHETTGVSSIGKAASWALWLLAFTHLLIWFRSSQQLRFLVPTLVVLNMGMLVFIARLISPRLLMGLTLLGALSVLSVQRDSIAIAVGRMESPFEGGRRRAVECFQRAGVGSEPVAVLHRDGFLGFVENDFYFLPGHSYHVPGKAVPAVAWVYSAEPTEGYVSWPVGNPCLQKKAER